MKKTCTSEAGHTAMSHMRREYRFDYSKARPNRFAARAAKGRVVVVLDPDISEVFTTPESVKRILRALIGAMSEGRKPSVARKLSGR